MDGEQAFSAALDFLTESWATQGIASKTEDPAYNKALGVKVCELLFEKSGRDIERYQLAVTGFIALSEEFVQLQFELDQTKHYRYSSFAEVRSLVYDNPELMETQYLNGLFLSTAFWVNHTKILDFFIKHFCSNNSSSGIVLEAPVGTGIFISEFARRNRGWSAIGIDLSKSSVDFSKELVRLNGDCKVAISQQDVFELPEDTRFDRIICGELLEHLEDPDALLRKLRALLKTEGKIFLTTAIWAASIDHIYLFKSADEVRRLLRSHFNIASELVLNVREAAGPEDTETPINYACILTT